MNQKICDFCGEIIKQKLFYLGIMEKALPKNEDKLAQFVTLEEAFHMMHKKQKELREKTKYFEVCEECKKVIDYFLTMRKDRIQDLKGEVQGIFKLSHLKTEEDSSGF